MTQAQVATLLGNAARVAQDIRERFEDGHGSSIFGLMRKIPSRQAPASSVLVSRTPSPLASPGVLRSSPTLLEASDPAVGGGSGRRASEEGPILLVSTGQTAAVSTGQTAAQTSQKPAPVFNLLNALNVLRPGFFLGKRPVNGSPVGTPVGTPNPSPEQGLKQGP